MCVCDYVCVCVCVCVLSALIVHVLYIYGCGDDILYMYMCIFDY